MLESDKNLDFWFGNSDCAILITHWVGEVHKSLQSADYNKPQYPCFEKTGSLITADESNDTTINPKGLINFPVPKSLAVQVSEDTLNCSISEPTQEPENIIMNENVPNDDMCIDDENDCEYDHILVNRKIHPCYYNFSAKVPFNRYY